MASTPLISVIMPVFNGAAFLEEAIESILNQTYSHLEFIILDDGSTDPSLDIIKGFEDPRIKLLVSEKNRGIIHQLNKGVGLAAGKYIARMDADDISKANRLQLQCDFLEQNSDIDLVGSQAVYIDEKGRKLGKTSNLPTNAETIRIYSLFYSPFVHPAVFGRTEVFKENAYVPEVAAEDQYLWVKILNRHKAANLPHPLLYHRSHRHNITKKLIEKYIDSSRAVYLKAFQQIGITLSEKELSLLVAITALNQKMLDKTHLAELDQFLQKLIRWNDEKKRFSPSILRRVLAEVWFRSCYKNRGLGLKTIRQFYSSAFGRTNPSLQSHLYFMAQCILETPPLKPVQRRAKRMIRSLMNLDL